MNTTYKNDIATMLKHILLIGAASLCFSSNAANSTQISAEVQQALTNENRPARDRKLDQFRKPAQVLDFFQIKPNTQILEIFPGGGYYTELLSNIAGEKGHVTLYSHSPWYFYSKSASDKRHEKKRLKNTHYVISDINTVKFPKEKFDNALIILGLHDLYLESEKDILGQDINPNYFIETLFKAVKPGGIVGVIEHEGKASNSAKDNANLHRLSSDIIKTLFKEAGFVLDAESNLLRNSSDTLEKIVWAKGLRRKTDRSVLRFKKPSTL